ncbi:DUF72 domain-containing protein [Danxiaibacter flavus]|uniref:DUF72 domain-containing protein n=1 Tax=Danxiaibacter flavus TaxID=3049108 RepID=A0ABV3ZEX6_9BACT|nr:DUF72 domain-containing protein [Chitinophagaceae bacterium DXS]
MEFGRVDENELNSIDFSLPAEPAFNKKVLKGKPLKNPKVYLGCAKWGRLEWVGKIYPKGTKEKDFLEHYVQHYNSIELNATHYKIYGPAGIAKWAEKAKGKDFVFCPKMYQGVTHRGSLKGKDFVTTEFLRGIVAFGEHLGPVFVQVSDTFSPKRKDELFEFLRSLPTDVQFFLEVRHPDWFEKEEVRDELFETLRSINMGAVITDTAGRRDCAHMHLPISKAFIRYVGNSLHDTDYTRMTEWTNRIKYWLDHGLHEVYFFMHMHDEATSPELTIDIVDKLNKACGLHLIKPKFVESPTLF